MADVNLILTEEEADIVRGCLVDRLHEQSQVIAKETSEALGGNINALSDASWKVRANGLIVDVLDRLGDGVLN